VGQRSEVRIPSGALCRGCGVSGLDRQKLNRRSSMAHVSMVVRRLSGAKTRTHRRSLNALDKAGPSSGLPVTLKIRARVRDCGTGQECG
jgi:hypothetical protein